MACCKDYIEGQQLYKCEKHRIDMCDACLKCKDPDLYCKFRSSCMIQFMEKERANGSVPQLKAGTKA
jgi:hypothetical protein